MGRQDFLVTLALMFLLNIVISNSAPSGHAASVVPRDTDKLSALREKLIRLNQLLSSVEDDEESDLKTVAVEQEKGKEDDAVATPAISEFMGSGKQSDAAPVQREGADQPREKPSQLIGDDRSIEILSKALARMRQPKYNTDDSTGEALGTLYNEPYVEDKNTEEMETMIERALQRLNQDSKTDNSQDQPLFDLGVSRKVSHPTDEDMQLREEAIRVVEARLMQDIVLANKLGISVEDLIEDLDDKAFMDARLKKIEEELDSLQRANDRY